jgi:hypothetical protein
LSNIKKALSKEEQQPFYDVTAMTNALLDEEKKAIDKEIISRILQKDKHVVDKRAFNPVFFVKYH